MPREVIAKRSGDSSREHVGRLGRSREKKRRHSQYCAIAEIFDLEVTRTTTCMIIYVKYCPHKDDPADIAAVRGWKASQGLWAFYNADVASLFQMHPHNAQTTASVFVLIAPHNIRRSFRSKELAFSSRIYSCFARLLNSMMYLLPSTLPFLLQIWTTFKYNASHFNSVESANLES